MSKFLVHTKDKEENIFATSLIVSCLAEVAPSSPDIDTLVTYILSKKHDDWSWRYGPQYPKDLDDTFCALIALHKSNHLPQTGTTIASVIKHLLKTEVSPGGPYKTWIVDQPFKTNNQTLWNDIDTGVNANVAYFLALQNIHLPRLAHHIDTACQTMTFSSLYYDSLFPLIYFISRFMGARKDTSSEHVLSIKKLLAERILQEIHPDGGFGNPLYTALSISSLVRLGYRTHVPLSSRYFLEHTKDSHGMWPAHPLYKEKISKDKTLYFESSAVTTAFVLEALSLFTEVTPIDTNMEHENIYKNIELRFTTLFSTTYSEFNTQAKNALNTIKKKHLEHFITLLPFSWSESLQSIDQDTYTELMSRETPVTLGLANLLGWIGYTLQDTIIDEHAGTDLLPFSNVCIRHAYIIFKKEALTEAMSTYIDTVFIHMDSANQNELQNICTNATSADKSFGHALGPLILLSRLGFGPDSPEFMYLETFFREYIIARQMLDDAHDIQEDTVRGKTNSIHTLFPDISPEVLDRDLWTMYIEEICSHIDNHLQKASQAHNSLHHVLKPSFGETLLRPLIQSKEKALIEKRIALEFLKEYNKSPSSPL